ncbi:hypothetical protein DL98DRAFT_595935 [Cadophora sp. DSE1049]|nr:hypothetical protein DL98DRAFT_595935 [Cadophora sp. DSE1049]
MLKGALGSKNKRDLGAEKYFSTVPEREEDERAKVSEIVHLTLRAYNEKLQKLIQQRNEVEEKLKHLINIRKSTVEYALGTINDMEKEHKVGGAFKKVWLLMRSAGNPSWLVIAQDKNGKEVVGSRIEINRANFFHTLHLHLKQFTEHVAAYQKKQYTECWAHAEKVFRNPKFEGEP